MQILTAVLFDQEGQGIIEYGLILLGISLAVVAAIWALSPSVSSPFVKILENL